MGWMGPPPRRLLGGCKMYIAICWSMLTESGLLVFAEIVLEVSWVLVSNVGSSGGSVSKLSRVLSHTNAFRQCSKWLDQNMAAVERVSCPSTSSAALEVKRQIERGGLGYAAICTPEAAAALGLDVVVSGIQDLKRNAVRFLVVSKETNLVGTANDKTMLTFVVQHTSGALSAALEIFAKHKVNMMHLESEPWIVESQHMGYRWVGVSVCQ